MTFFPGVKVILISTSFMYLLMVGEILTPVSAPLHQINRWELCKEPQLQQVLWTTVVELTSENPLAVPGVGGMAGAVSVVLLRFGAALLPIEQPREAAVV